LKSLETLENPFQGISRGPRGSRDEFISESVLKPLGNFKKNSSKTSRIISWFKMATLEKICLENT